MYQTPENINYKSEKKGFTSQTYTRAQKEKLYLTYQHNLNFLDYLFKYVLINKSLKMRLKMKKKKKILIEKLFF